ncbi:ABC transporter substrate-binding protein [Rhodococcus erythropolis]|uniref:ABC transporter substrate-binding protein n=1 Tax=Rhodococcus erythropolis TaxID=1833 RepID=UPI00379D6BA3
MFTPSALRRPVLSTVIVSVVLATAGCAGSAIDAADSSAPASPTATVRFALANPPTQFDPIASKNEAADITYFNAMYDGVTGADSEGRVVGRLADAYEQTPDGLTWQFHIRDGATFHDGSTIDAQAVTTNLQRALDAVSTSGIIAQKLGSVASIAADGDNVILTMKTPDPGIPASLASPVLGIISPASFTTAANAPVGSGPYKFTSRGADKVVYSKFAEYWNPSTAKAAGLELSSISDSVARLNALRSGQIDATFATSDQPADIDAMQSDSAFVVEELQTQSVATLFVNTSHPPLDNVAVRQALNYAIDRDSIAEDLFGGKCKATEQPFPTGAGYVDSVSTNYSFDPLKAKQMLADAGVQSLELNAIFRAGGGTSQALAPAIQAQFAEVGVTLNTTSVTAAEARPQFRAGGPDLMIHQINAELDPAASLRNNYLGLDNPGGSSPAVTAAAEAMLPTALESAERTEALQDFTKALAAEPVHIQICNLPNYFIGSSSIVGLDEMPFGSILLNPDVRTLGVRN